MSDDPRPLFGRALDQAERLVSAIRPDELGHPTPCAEYDVRALLGHMVAVLSMLAHVGAGGDPAGAPAGPDAVDDGWADVFRDARAGTERVWSDDEVLDRAVRLSWATMPGREVLEAYAHEFTVHAWDLAYATGRLTQLDDPRLAACALDWFALLVPPESRDEQGPFGPVVPVGDDADVFTRLAAYTGRRP